MQKGSVIDKAKSVRFKNKATILANPGPWRIFGTSTLRLLQCKSKSHRITVIPTSDCCTHDTAHANNYCDTLRIFRQPVYLRPRLHSYNSWPPQGSKFVACIDTAVNRQHMLILLKALFQAIFHAAVRGVGWKKKKKSVERKAEQKPTFGVR